MDLIEFLLARIDEDEAVAYGRRMDSGRADSDASPTAPWRLLAECEAKRRIVEPWMDEQDEDDWRYGIHAEAHQHVLRLLALPYADHPDYDPSWRP